DYYCSSYTGVNTWVF
nr:immunoglobulin light chain junction region [Macaca mulatta]